MFDLPQRSQLFRLRDEEYSEWMNRLSDRNTMILGSSPAGLVAGRFLQRQGIDTFLLEESEQLGGRLFWESGPVPVFSPADELLEELEFSIQSNPPIWLDRVEILEFLFHGYLEEGGLILPGIYIESLPDLHEPAEIEFTTGEQSEVVNVEQGILTEPYWDIELESDADDPMTAMVRQTKTVDSGWVIAGQQALSPSDRDQNYPFLSSELLSGRKAVECILSGE